MWMAPVLYVGLTIFLWKYAGAVFMPELMARRVFALVPVLEDAQLAVVINVAVIYFGVYLMFALMWQQVRPYFKNAFLAALVLWLVNVLVLFPMLGRGVLGYGLPQGWASASLPLLVSHGVFARGLQFQEKRE